MPKVFMTGTSGFIGGFLVPKLLEENYEIYALCRNVTDRKLTLPKDVNIVWGDLIDSHHLRKTISAINPEIVVHLAAQSSVAYSHEHAIENAQTTYLGTINMQKACEGLSNLEKFIFSGTSEEYGNQQILPITEDAPLKPNTPYAIAKVAADYYLQYCKESIGFPSITLRPFNTYGRIKNFTFVTEKIIYEMFTKDKIVLGSPYPIRDLMYVDDHVNGYINTIEIPFDNLEGLEAINLCTGIGTSIEDLANTIKNLMGFKGEILWNIKTRPTEINSLIGDYTLAKEYLGWSPRYNLIQGLEKTISNIKEKLDK